MPTYRLVETSGFARILALIKMCFLNVLRLHVSQNQRQKRLYKQYMDQLSGAYVERCTDLSPFRYSYRVPSPEWRYNLSCDEHYWCSTECSRSCCGSDCSDSGRCSSPCCSEVIFNGGQHFSGKAMHACHRLPVCYPGNFGETGDDRLDVYHKVVPGTLSSHHDPLHSFYVAEPAKSSFLVFSFDFADDVCPL